jgi:integrase
VEIRALGREHVRALFEAARGVRLEALYVLAVTTRLRRGELQGLTWEDVDLDAGTILGKAHALRAPWRVIFEALKSGKGRQIRLTQRATVALKEDRKRQLEERMERGALWQDHGLVFPSGVGKPLLGGNLNRAFKALLQHAGLPEIRFHDLQHTCATLLLRQGVNSKFVHRSF